MVVHVHGAPLHIRAIDDAGDFFHDTYGGRMINLWDLVPVISGWGNAMVAAMTDAEKKEDGASLHGGMDEHSLILHLQPRARRARLQERAGGHRSDRRRTASTWRRRPGWPGYLGSPRLATAALGENDLEGVLGGGDRADAEDSRRRGSVGDPALRRHPGKESALPEGMDRAGEGATTRRSTRRNANGCCRKQR